MIGCRSRDGGGVIDAAAAAAGGGGGAAGGSHPGAICRRFRPSSLLSEWLPQPYPLN